jgi:choline dehydrogenase-like flavoprotein
MLTDAEDLTDGHLLRARVCVVGAGPAGLSLADSLAGAGVDVLLLEAAGPGLPTGPLETTRSVGTPYSVASTRRRGLGGSARAWNIATPLGAPYVRLRELDALDLAPRPGLREVGWPLVLADLRPHYRDAWALFGLPPVADPPQVPDASPPEAPAGATGDGEVRPFRFGPASAFTERLPQRLAASPRVQVVTGAVVTDVRTDTDAGTVSGLRCATRTGAALTAEAQVYVLAGGGIENARLLLASRSRHPEGLGNASDHVGRHFMEHPHYASAVVRPGDHRLEDQPALWDLHVEDGVAVQRKQALTRAATEREGLLSTAYYLGPRRISSLVVTGRTGGLHPRRSRATYAWREALRSRRLPPHALATLPDALLALPGAAQWAATQARAERAVRRGRPRSAMPRTMTLRGMAEQVPNPRSRVRLTSTPDAFGVPTAELDWRLTDTDWGSMARSQALLLPHLRAVYGGRVDSVLDVTPHPHVVGGAHHMGTTRMAASPREGVVDADCRVHGLTNLYVAGSSVFPAVGSANPTLTLVALSLRLGAHLRDRLGP